MVLSLACELQTRGSTLMTNIIRLLTAGAAALIASAACALGANFSFTGTFSDDEQILLFGFTVDDPTVKVKLSAGGTKPDGAKPPGNFDPVLSLFGSDGSLLSFNDDDINTGSFDSLINQSLSAGSYTLALTQATSGPFGPDLAAGFTGSGAKNFNGRTNVYAVDILGVATASPLQPPPAGVPDSGSTLALFVLSVGGLVGLRRFVNRA